MTRVERLQFYRDIIRRAAAKSEAHVHELERRLARTDLFYLLVILLKRRDINRDWLYERCNEVQASPNGHLDLWAREHYKSTLITFGKTIQDVLIDPENTIGVFSHTRSAAKGFLRPIKVEFENNEDLKRRFPDILWSDPRKEAPKWSENDGLIVKRKGNPKEATLEAWGLVEGMPTGKHFGIRVYDDVIDQDSVRNPDAIRKTIEAWELSLSLGRVGGVSRYIGTRYHFADPYREMMSRGAVKPRIYPCTREGTYPGTPVLMPAALLAEKRRDMGLYTFGAQMLQDPTADKKQGFRRDWLRHYTNDNAGAGMNRYILVDPANAKKKESDYTAMAVIGLGADENYYLLDAIRDRLNLKERTEALFALHRRWRPNGVGYEEYGLQADIEHMQLEMEDANYRFDITPLGGNIAKHDRIRRLAPIFEAGRFYLPESLRKADYEGRIVDLVVQFIEEEFASFPVGLHEDLFDCMARIRDEKLGAVFPKPTQPDDRYAKPWRRKRHHSTSHMAA